MEKIPSLNDDDIEKILHPSSLFSDDLRPLEKDSSANGIEDIINPSLEPQPAAVSSNESIANIPHEPGQHLIHRMYPVGMYGHQDDRLNKQLMPTKMFRNARQTSQSPQQTPQSTPGTRHTKTRPAFVNKVWSMLNDESNVNLIQWSPDGKSFIVVNREEFVHEVLPKYFKHSNLASFVRQLNMYGWHKVQDVKSGSIQNSSDDKLQFENEYFIRGREDLLEKIVRQKSSAASSSKMNPNGNNGGSANGADLHLMGDLNLGDHPSASALLGELEQIKYNQMAISKDLLRINKDNELLWKENMMARERHRTQQQALEKILRFLASLVPHMDQKMITEGILNSDDQPQELHLHQETGDNSNNTKSATNPTGYDIFDQDFMRNLHKSRFLLKNRTNSSVSNTAQPPLDQGDAKISEIPFDEDEDEQEPKQRSSTHRNSISGEDTVSFLNHLQSNIDEQDARIQHLEDMVQVISPQGSNVRHNFDLQDYCFNSESPMDTRRPISTGLSPLLAPDDLTSLQTHSPSNIIQELGHTEIPTAPAASIQAPKRYHDSLDTRQRRTEPLVEEIPNESLSSRKRLKR
ncbi:hypothetical protein HG537_0E05320 [Torulaspora globosa]|uniref:Heat shock transcription factor n=1 Tax=Torulaspora globosa TaxID=48254 RepID=A0A7H9HWM3_9SACH|nr:hypothetical protein HG537_0E05320 [Torulaspora sp. CBS 2947]